MIDCCYNAWNFGKFNWECNRLAIVREGRSINNSPLQLHANSNVTKRNLVGCCSKIKARHIFFGQCHFTNICWGCSIIGIYRNAYKANLIKRNREIYPAELRCNPVISPLLICQRQYTGKIARSAHQQI